MAGKPKVPDNTDHSLASGIVVVVAAVAAGDLSDDIVADSRDKAW